MSNQTITPNAGALSLTGAAPTSGLTIAPKAGTLLMLANSVITPNTGALNIVGLPVVILGNGPTITPNTGRLYMELSLQTVLLTPNTGALGITGYAPLPIGVSYAITPVTGALSITGYLPAQTLMVPPPPSGALSLTGYAPTITILAPNIGLVPQTGSMGVTGYAPRAGGGIRPTTGILSLVGYSPLITNGNYLAAAIAEGHDRVAGLVGITNYVSASIAEQPEAITGNIAAAMIVAAAIAEGGDIVAGGLLVEAQLAAAIVEANEAVTGLLIQAVDLFAAITEGNDSSIGSILLAANFLSAYVIEGNDAVTAFVGSAPNQFGYAEVIAVSQAGLQGAESSYLANSSCTVTATYFNQNGLPFVPSAVSYQMTDTFSGAVLVPWTELQPEPVNEVVVTALENALVSFTASSEQHQVLFSIVDSVSNVYYAATDYNLIRIPSTPNPDYNQLFCAATEGADIVTSEVT